MQFFLGQDGDGETVGVVLFQQVDTPHGPSRSGSRSVPTARSRRVVTTATVETKPWVQEAVASGLMNVRRHAAGRRPAEGARSVGGKLGGMPQYMAELIATAVGRGLVLYGTLYKESAS